MKSSSHPKAALGTCARVALALCSFMAPICAAELEPGFKPIFDGRSFSGWKAPDMGYWSIEDGAITARISKEHPCGANQYLVWQGGELADFELKLKSRVNGEGAINNGFQFRSRLLPDGDIAGYQVDNNLQTDWLVRLYDEFGRHTLAFRGKRTVFDAEGRATQTDLSEAAGPAWFRLEEWHEYDLTCDGPHLTLKVDGRLAAEVIDDDRRRADLQGILGLQLHSGPPTVVQFKDIRLTVLRSAAPAKPGPPEPKRDRLLGDALAHWDLSAGGHGGRHPLRYVGPLEQMELNVRADGAGSRPDDRVALVRGGYFDAGKDLNISGDKVTVYLRTRDPSGKWDGALMAKRGNHERVNFNLYSSGGVIGFEAHTGAGFVNVNFPASEIDRSAWHDLVGRYDGRSIGLMCDGRVMCRTNWNGVLTSNEEPLLVGAETDNGKVARQFIGEMEEAAVWARALADAECAAVMRVKSLEPKTGN